MKIVIGVLAILLLSACVNLPGPSQEKEADYGTFPDDYQDIARTYLMAELRDPPSIEIKNISEPMKRWIGDKFTGIGYGYLVCVEVNSKNVFGNLTGFRNDALLIRDDTVIDYIKDGELLSGMKLCD
ncbi:hypothetical protein [Glaciecola sp. SC05]|uniref:hypothetical protein n=1 Tax=Glaciecola sp. SC05 TaxID=1987355 RepID=UPI003527FBFC